MQVMLWVCCWGGVLFIVSWIPVGGMRFCVLLAFRILVVTSSSVLYRNSKSLAIMGEGLHTELTAKLSNSMTLQIH